ncbi:MAG TPA: hypothetical protein VE988_26625 [Gemmataceae bacterium]|nr:hypothetical protein [Gemmataceae bacterium]
MSVESVASDKTPWNLSWEVMMARAWRMLENSADIQPSLVVDGFMTYRHPRLRLWDDAMGFGCESEPTSFTVFNPLHDAKKRPLVRQAVWHRTEDLRRLHALVEKSNKQASFQPAITVRDAEISAGQFDALLNAGAKLRVSIAWLDAMKAVTCDVGSVGFEFFSLDQPPAVIQLQWAWDKPEEWQPVVEWVKQLRTFLEKCLANAE